MRRLDRFSAACAKGVLAQQRAVLIQIVSIESRQFYQPWDIIETDLPFLERDQPFFP